MIKVNHNYTVGSLLELLNGFPSDEGVITITPDNAVIAGDFSLSAISQHGQTVTLLEASDVVLGNVSGFFV
ncbi:MAG: hypothetical protein GJ680_07800 [Alteromonadaceae bacterium]|nr:hypothetical protein [Alteromonadaceae bacterium]